MRQEKVMKKAILFCSILTLVVGNGATSSDGPTTKTVILTDTNYQTVCLNGDLSGLKEQMNMLPIGFSGNVKDTGVVEVGGKAGSESGRILPPLVMELNGTVALGFTFDSKASTFSSGDKMRKIGFDLELSTPNGTLKDENIRTSGTILEFLTQRSATTWSSETTGNHFKTRLCYDDAYRTLFLLFTVKTMDRLKSAHLYYSDVPVRVANVSLFLYDAAHAGNHFYSHYLKNDCSAKNYIIRVDAAKIYELESQFGYVFSKDYLLRFFVYQDPADSKKYHPTIIDDPDNYFATGMNAPMGTVFTIKVMANSSTGESSCVVFRITVKDTMAPKILCRFDSGPLMVSYRADFSDAAFVDRHFAVYDNLDASLLFQATLANGNPLPKKTVGDFSAKFLATDSHGNTGSVVFPLTLIDDVPPLLTVRQEELFITENTALTRGKLLSLFTATDEIDGDVSPVVTNDTYTGNEARPGLYEFAVEAKDKSGNLSTKSIRLHVQTANSPVWYATESFLTVTKGSIPTLDEIVAALISQNVLPRKDYRTCDVVEGEAITNDLAVGVHQMRLRLTDSEDSIEEVPLTLNVVEKTSSENTSENLFFWEKILRWFKALWQAIIDFFTRK
jgi:hypothetical protein